MMNSMTSVKDYYQYMSEADVNWFDGMQAKAVEAARSFYANGASIELIAKSLHMTEEEIREIVNTPVTVKA